jgi:hypothetical protein
VRRGDPVSENRRIARDVVRLIEAAEASLDERGAPIALGDPVSI